MGADRGVERARRGEPSWDELRERRVLARVLAERVEAARRARVAAGGGVLLVAAAAALVLAWMGRSNEPAIATHAIPTHDTAIGTAVSEVPVGEGDDASPGRLSLRDGSEIELGDDARVEIGSQSASDVRLIQRAGEARYVVSHRPERPFVVSVGDVEVRVRGTRFVVRVSDPWTEVEVEEGRVEVARADEIRTLTAGEALRVRSRIESEADLAAQAAETEAAEAEAAEAEAAEAEAAALETESRGEAERPAVPTSAASAQRVASMEVLLADADAARRAGRLEDAARALRTAIAAHAEDPRVATALFTLGRVERARGHEAAAARAFDGAYTRAPRGALAEDALAEAAVSWSSSGRTERGRAAAERYLALHPTGLYVGRVRQLLE